MRTIKAWVMVLLLAISLTLPLGKQTYAASLESMLATLDQTTYGSTHSEKSYKEVLDVLSGRCTENRMKIGDWTVTGTKLLREHGGNIDNFNLLKGVVQSTEGRSNLSCKEEFQSYSTLRLFDLLNAG
ncbi:MAG: hypothetical protein NW220_17445 [Leptolyngbyaceae cyanobacterium bins.349]|nr:hypothetical protein [Leptolyngbyaceae cyanobacterium bins.349]